jgi:hypothetical protein
MEANQTISRYLLRFKVNHKNSSAGTADAKYKSGAFTVWVHWSIRLWIGVIFGGFSYLPSITSHTLIQGCSMVQAVLKQTICEVLRKIAKQ